MRKPIYALAGDLMFTRGETGLGGLIRWAERTEGEGPSWANHVGIVSQDGWIIPPAGYVGSAYALVIESLWRTIEHEWFPAQGKLNNRVSIWRNASMTTRQRWVAVNRARQFVGAKYGWWKLGLHLIDNRLFGGRVVTRRALHVDSRPICSYTAARSYASAGVRTGRIPPASQSPDTIWDYVQGDSDWWEIGRGVA